MKNMETVIRHIAAEISIARTCKKDLASVDIDMLSDAYELLKEHEKLEGRLQHLQEVADEYHKECHQKLEGFVRVVRCKECRWKNHSAESSKRLPCMDYFYGENFFCKYGERKDES